MTGNPQEEWHVRKWRGEAAEAHTDQLPQACSCLALLEQDRAGPCWGGSQWNASLLPVWILGFAGGLQAHPIPGGAPLAQQTPSSWQTYVLAAHRCGGCRHIRPPVKALSSQTARPGDGDTSAARPLALLLMEKASQAGQPWGGPVSPSPRGDGADIHGDFCPTVDLCYQPLLAAAPSKTNWAPGASPDVCVPDLQDLLPLPGSTPSSFQAPFSCPRALPFRTPLQSPGPQFPSLSRTSSRHDQPPSCSVSWLFINWMIEDRTHHPKFTTSPSWLQLRSSKFKFQKFANCHASDYLPGAIRCFFAYDHDAKWYVWPSPGHSVTGADASAEPSGM